MIDSIQDDRTAEAATVHDLAALGQRIEHRINERHRLVAAFDSLADGIKTALADGRSPLSQIAELDRLNHRIHQLERDLTEEMENAAKKVFTFSESEHGPASLSFKAKVLKNAK